jgi:hypothetical protein
MASYALLIDFKPLLIFPFNFPSEETNTKIYLFEMKKKTKTKWIIKMIFMRKQSKLYCD